ncbi:hypothetical protein DB88DRAFT_35516 [Papiliotrema laurentii]|uniref:Uncharacterized protein n=1 Tax=Papiliotrema laurentii TaxID=5418 RepID=A0AAD9FWE5_PAPLA|nr:hypothetical protein DB88DRAFT_35516 [Papiliotrema laurentii]
MTRVCPNPPSVSSSCGTEAFIHTLAVWTIVNLTETSCPPRTAASARHAWLHPHGRARTVVQRQPQSVYRFLSPRSPPPRHHQGLNSTNACRSAKHPERGPVGLPAAVSPGQSQTGTLATPPPPPPQQMQCWPATAPAQPHSASLRCSHCRCHINVALGSCRRAGKPGPTGWTRRGRVEGQEHRSRCRDAFMPCSALT